MKTASTMPNLSLQISPPTVLDCELRDNWGYGSNGFMKKSSYSTDRSSTTESGSSGGSDLSHENGFFSTKKRFNHGRPVDQPTLSLGFDMEALNPLPAELPRNLHHHQQHHQQHDHHRRRHHSFQPQTYGCEFKRSSRMVNGVKRSVRAPRMRWTSTLHAHFVHAVQLLGGHESEGQKENGLKQRTGIVEVETGLSTEKAEYIPSYSLNPSPRIVLPVLSPLLQKDQR
ncbi:hypothetical protein U1Q18_045901 [Sarracenia purpurea var. burkii]